jgi:hypothetical protein
MTGTLNDRGKVMSAERKTKECECGQPKSYGSTACLRCIYLDGERPKQAAVIYALRGTDGLSLVEICELVNGYSTHSVRTGMQRTMTSLMKVGRVRRYLRDDEGANCWAYALDGKTESEWRGQ